MKKILASLLFALMAWTPLQADETTNHDNRLYITMEDISDITQVPITLHLNNPTIDITAIEMYITLPEGVNINAIESGTRNTATHKIITGDTPDGYFISIASEKLEKFDNTEGTVCTVICNFSTLADGDCTITTSGVFAVGVDGDNVTSYTAANQVEQFTISGGTMTGIEKISPNAGRLEIYNLQGTRLSEPQKGQINIINGKKVIL